MLEPKKVKFRRHHRGNRRGMASRGNHVAFGSFGLKAVSPGWITSRQIEAARITISRVVRKTGKCGFEFSLINQLQKNRLRHEWVKEKGHQNIGLLL